MMNLPFNIYASAVFQSKSADEKLRILSALDNPVNLELVKQFASYLDKEYRTEDNLVHEEARKSESHGQAETPNMGESERMPMSTPHSSGGSGGSLFDQFNDLSEELPEDNIDVTDTESESEETVEEPESESTEASTVIGGETISASESPIHELDLDSLIGTLNIADETTGVSRAKKINNEVWIYYNDKINLNNIMESVISTLSRAGYSTLEFNRLARSENAIVFIETESVSSITE